MKTRAGIRLGGSFSDLIFSAVINYLKSEGC